MNEDEKLVWYAPREMISGEGEIPKDTKFKQNEETPVHIQTKTGSKTIMAKTQVSTSVDGDIFVTVEMPKGSLDEINMGMLTGFSIDHYNTFTEGTQ